ncbi:hypothetical protein LCGC14_0420690 [marine sediment metagenome]|uniref:Uncharacterized protein n=1 Tax=marine sediment metagenome TaxID=412755 RepID=A0A0F9SR38_9ZZZZ
MIDKKKLLNLIKSIDWSQFVLYGAVEVHVKKGKPTTFDIKETVKVD